MEAIFEALGTLISLWIPLVTAIWIAWTQYRKFATEKENRIEDKISFLLEMQGKGYMALKRHRIGYETDITRMEKKDPVDQAGIDLTINMCENIQGRMDDLKEIEKQLCNQDFKELKELRKYQIDIAECHNIMDNIEKMKL